jgi:spore maturation protein SpmA
MKKFGAVGVVLMVAGVVLAIIGNRIYYSNPYYNNTTDPIGIALTLIGVAALIIGIVVRVRARRAGADETRASLVAADLARAKARDAGAVDASIALDQSKEV